MSADSLSDLSSVIDHKALMSRCLNNLQFAERILTMFQGRCEIELAELDRALEAGDKEAMLRVAHRLQGASANAAAFGLQACASDLRNAVREESLEEASVCLGKLRDEWDRFTQTIKPHQKLTTSASV